MTDYRAVVRHVRYWRGTVHRWSVVWRFTGTLPSSTWPSTIAACKAISDQVCYKGPGAQEGGIYEVALYDQASGGMPISLTTYFDWTTPGSWIPVSGSAWPAHTTLQDAQAETALQVEWHAGLSATGKPVIFRKWFHSVPVTTATPPAVDVIAGTVTSLQNAINAQIAIVGGNGAPMGTGSRLAATTCVVRPYYGNHQMPRGRRRPALVAANGTYKGPVVQVPSGGLQLD